MLSNGAKPIKYDHQVSQKDKYEYGHFTQPLNNDVKIKKERKTNLEIIMALSENMTQKEIAMLIADLSIRLAGQLNGRNGSATNTDDHRPQWVNLETWNTFFQDISYTAIFIWVILKEVLLIKYDHKGKEPNDALVIGAFIFIWLWLFGPVEAVVDVTACCTVDCSGTCIPIPI